MKIKRISWTNYRGLVDGEIIADGSDVIVRGQNGVGKSSIASVVPFVLFKTGADKIKRYDGGFLPIDDGLTHGAEVEFDDGTTLRREVSNKGACYLNGVKVLDRAFSAEVNRITRGGNELLMNLFDFCRLDKKLQRKQLIEVFGAGNIDEILNSPEFKGAAEILDGRSEDKFLMDAQKELRKQRDMAKIIPGKIEVLERQFEEHPSDPDVEKTLKTELETLVEERNAVQAETFSSTEELTALREERASLSAQNPAQKIESLERDKHFYEGKLIEAKSEFESLRAEYLQVKETTAGKCPTCGQTMPLDKFKAQQQKKIDKLGKDGWRVKGLIDEVEKILADINSQLDTLKNSADTSTAEKISELDAKIKSLVEREISWKNNRQDRLTDFNKRIDELTADLAVLSEVAKAFREIAKLRESNRRTNERIVELEGQIKLIKRLQIRKLELVEEQVNANFEHVQFKLFELVKTTGEIKPHCEATLHGVPYSALSKGERLKAALDISRTLQAQYGVELPLLIDDAESYTRNSFIDLPNQIWLFKVSDESELIIEVKNDKRAAA